MKYNIVYRHKEVRESVAEETALYTCGNGLRRYYGYHLFLRPNRESAEDLKAHLERGNPGLAFFVVPQEGTRLNEYADSVFQGMP